MSKNYHAKFGNINPQCFKKPSFIFKLILKSYEIYHCHNM